MLAYLTAMAISAGIYALMALGVNLTWGMAGMVNLGLAGFFAVGAYATALLTKAGVAIPLGVAAAAVAAAITGAAVALITARLRADYLAIVTLGFSESVRIAAANEIWLTNGSDGIAGIPGPWRGILSPQQFNLMFLGIVVVVLAAVFVVLQRIGRSPFGRVLRAIRDDEDVAAVAGKHVVAFKVKAFAVGAAVLGIAGALYAHETSYVAPDIFAPLLTLNIILALVAGGVGNNAGAVLGAVLIVAVLEGTRFAAPLMPFLEPAQVAAVRELLVSVLLLVIMRALPEGIIRERVVA
ncbi:MAG TPA: branched-chain amino acid ABC transporter permease [Acetobacteraceae bacterium]|jgi:branched-chain amino acid transport system permease protein|nr:branched-chain amino acid ABC transporter permease [Acetobacteraceae bacterium]